MKDMRVCMKSSTKSSQVCPGPGGYRTFKFIFQLRICHRYVKKTDSSTLLEYESYS
eukprot:SAG31_NODE_3518_length_4166_cov_19.123433_2_plen_56_part_00